MTHQKTGKLFDMGLQQIVGYVADCGGGDIKAVGWVNLLSEPRSKLQGLWSSKLRQRIKDRLLRDLSPNDQVDLRTAGGPGAGGIPGSSCSLGRCRAKNSLRP